MPLRPYRYQEFARLGATFALRVQPIERALRYAELSSELASRAAESFYSPDEIAIFDVRKRHDVLVFTEESRSVCRRQRQVGARHGTIRPLRRCAEHIFELSHIARPIVSLQHLDGFVGDCAGMNGRNAANEKFGKRRNVLLALA